MKPLGMILALARNDALGKDGKLPWRYPEDLRHFRDTTRGHAVIMGRKTWDEVGKPLPGRTNVVVTRSPGFAPEGAIVARSVEDAIARAREVDETPFVIGGAQIYALAMPFVTDVHLTRIDRDAEADTFFPLSLDGFVLVSSRVGETPALTFSHWRRTP